MSRHKLPPEVTSVRPKWWNEPQFVQESDCLYGVLEDVATAEQLARHHRAPDHRSCDELLAAASKSLKTLLDPTAPEEIRTAAGERALRKFWEAKVCARRESAGRSLSGLCLK